MEKEVNQPQTIVKSSNRMPNPLVFGAVFVVLAGMGVGYFFSQQGKVGGITNKIEVAPGAVVKENEAGLDDEKTFKDEATGVLKEGGIEGEGSHHLERDGGESQNVYLTSSVIDLDDFTEEKVTVWGETNKGQKAGWLMDVGKIRIIE